MKPLTRMQQQVFDFICRYSTEEGFPPSYSEIASHFAFSSDGTVRTYLEHLERKGFIKRLGRARGIQILKPQTPTAIPILGHIAAGAPLLAQESDGETLEDIPELHHKEGRIALRIKGDSMINAGIHDGDVAIIQTGEPVRNGQIAAVLLEDEATLKRVYFDEGQGQVRLQPENDQYAPLYIDQRVYDARILGKYIALVRRA